MTARIACHGRLGADPVARVTSGGRPMATASLACDVARGDAGEPDTEWFDLLAFGRQAEALLRHRQGDLLAVMGSLTRRRWTGEDGSERARWSVLCDAIVSARVVRPGGGRRRGDGHRERPASAGHGEPQTAELADAIPF
ncbi:MAG TPA: single-stranded DNA-binding protein [Polyangiaceae bacterium]|nr:single-stranded DNA-binding protein [Polyangiaceae bacterium]